MSTVRTDQELYDFVRDRLIEQGKSSYEGGMCKYRSADGSKCAAGHLIKDEHYSPTLEGHGCFTPKVNEALFASGVKEDQLPLVRALQVVHDRSAICLTNQYSVYIREHLEFVASDFGLTP